ncbi:S41 family peptidase [Pelomonas sp. KK5]|uniref:S41 family peptidase n=1 Tax=Pelomonas sp. KK5 TaxID=1855730 RepID=UPI00097CA636|nr:S41 family peptidase [Pelomonas sp. KK5]
MNRGFKRAATALAAALALISTAGAAPALLRQPSLSKDRIAFVYSGDIWTADRNGANARQLTSAAAAETAPHFSPDGQWIAFSASYDGNTDVYVMPAAGGQPRRLTWHPGADLVNGWSADGQRVLFTSAREVANSRSRQLWEVPAAGGAEKKVMDAVVFAGEWSPDGQRIAYQNYLPAYSGASGWRQHRGGSTPAVWIIDPARKTWEKIPHVNANDINPVWSGADEVIFVSDRADDTANLFAYSTKTRQLRQLTHETTWDVHSAAVQGGIVVYEAGGVLKELTLASGAIRKLDIQLTTAAPLARPQWKDASHTITSAQLSATGKRVLVSARGEVFTVPVKDGSVRNLTHSGGVREKDALWSPDGQSVAYIAEAGHGPQLHHQLVMRDQAGMLPVRTYALGGTGYFTLLAWSPDGKRLAYQDNHLNLYVIEPGAAGKDAIRKVATSQYRSSFEVAFSPDGRWLAYTVAGANYFSQVRMQDLATGKDIAVSDGLSQAGNPVFATKDESDWLFFTSSINSGPQQWGLDMSTQERALRSGIFVAVLNAAGKSPLEPKDGDEDTKTEQRTEEKKKEEAKDKQEKPASTAKPPKLLRVDEAGLQQRIVGLPVAERNYDSLAVASDGALFYLEHRQPGISHEPPGAGEENDAELYRFDFEEKKSKSLKDGLRDFRLSADGKVLLLRYGEGKLETAEAKDKLDAKPVDLSGLKTFVDPRQEWAQIFDETWWMEKEFFYDPKLHGIDWDGIYKRYRPLVDAVQRREELNDLMVEMIGELQVGHNRVSGGDVYSEPSAKVGLLGADFAVEHGRYRIKTILGGDRWNPFLKAPLAVPGQGARVGEYLLAVNGRPLDATAGNLYALLENTVGKQVVLTLAQDADGKVGSRQITVQPVASETMLRRWAWIEKNRQYVQDKSGGRVAYVYLPETADEGFQHFNRMFFAQVDKDALIVDDRRNSGGQAANYVIDVLSRPYLASWKDRDGLVADTPAGAIYGPKAMLIDQDAGSGGDFLPYAFKRQQLGPLIGKRTWGGLIGISANPDLIDGGKLVVPFFRFFTPDGEWRVENEGVAPDIEVDLDPLQVNEGRDAQLDAAIAQVMGQLKDAKARRLKSAPAMPVKLGH